MVVLIGASHASAHAPPDDISHLEWETLPETNTSVDALLERADHAAKLNLFGEADRLYRRILQRDPGHSAAYRKLTVLWDGRRLPVESEALDDVRPLLPNFTELKTRHFVVISDAPGHVVQEHATRLERALHEFHRYAKRLDLQPLPLQHRLVCVLFDQRDDYADFARSYDGVHADWIAGYYTPRHDRVVFYNALSNPGVVQAHSDLAALESDVQQARQQAREASKKGAASHARRMHQEIEQYRQHLNQQRREVEAFAEHFSTATTVHETMHQLLFHTQVQTPFVEYPFWISEGLATAFETESISISFGPDFEFAPRRTEFEELLRSDQLLQLRSFVAITRPPADDPDTVHVLYHQSYALLTWLHRHRRNDLVQYIWLMRHHEPGRLSAQEHVSLFEQAFGKIDQLERTWLKDERLQIK